MNFQSTAPLPDQESRPEGPGEFPHAMNDGVVEVDVGTVWEWMAQNRAVLVDVREMNEFENERIPGALLMPLSFFDAENFPRIPGKKVVLMCAIGKRSHVAGMQLLKAGHPAPINMSGGLNAWKAAGYATEE
jgi:rhodanese-related sulfurtransferase